VCGLTFLRGRLLGPKRWLHRRFVARTAMRPFALAVASLRLRWALGRDSSPAALANQLTRGWGNPGYAASPQLVETVIREVRRREGPVLECGSGVTTVVLATARRCFGTEVLSLEHERTWADAVRRRLRWLLLPCDHVVHRPLERRGSHDWYAVDESEVPGTVALVVCDGPPAATLGGGVACCASSSDPHRPSP
jgi:hypothetical protein